MQDLPSGARLLPDSSIALEERAGNERGRTVSTGVLSTVNLFGAHGVGFASAGGALCSDV
jgi:hypothetical protein